MLEVSWFSSAK
ncbi:hypothetical protein D049_0441A, partial [Vibrio parahaemolyticus VPTS-2010]